MRIFRLWGADVYLNPFFLGLLLLFFAAGVLGKGLIAFAVVLLHEFAHVLTARKLGIAASRVELLPFGGVAKLESDIAVVPSRELKIAAAGPALNFFMIFLAVTLKNNGIWHQELGPFFIQCNLILAFFNLIPALPLDGGRVYRAYLVPRVGLAGATRTCAVHGQLWAVILFLLGILGLYSGATGLDISLTALFLFYAATREKNMIPYLFIRNLARKSEELIKEEVLAVKVIVALESVPLGRIINDFFPGKYHLVKIVDTNSAVKGEVTETQIIEKIMEGCNDLPVGSL